MNSSRLDSPVIEYATESLYFYNAAGYSWSAAPNLPHGHRWLSARFETLESPWSFLIAFNARPTLRNVGPNGAAMCVRAGEAFPIPAGAAMWVLPLHDSILMQFGTGSSGSGPLSWVDGYLKAGWIPPFRLTYCTAPLALANALPPAPETFALGILKSGGSIAGGATDEILDGADYPALWGRQAHLDLQIFGGEQYLTGSNSDFPLELIFTDTSSSGVGDRYRVALFPGSQGVCQIRWPLPIHGSWTLTVHNPAGSYSTKKYHVSGGIVHGTCKPSAEYPTDGFAQSVTTPTQNWMRHQNFSVLHDSAVRQLRFYSLNNDATANLRATINAYVDTPSGGPVFLTIATLDAAAGGGAGGGTAVLIMPHVCVSTRWNAAPSAGPSTWRQGIVVNLAA